MIIQFGILFLFLALGEIAVYFTGVPVPSSIIGMILLTCALKARLVKLSQVDKTANFMVHNLGFFFCSRRYRAYALPRNSQGPMDTHCGCVGCQHRCDSLGHRMGAPVCQIQKTAFQWKYSLINFS